MGVEMAETTERDREESAGRPCFEASARFTWSRFSLCVSSEYVARLGISVAMGGGDKER
jgi:hypothetical protein